uniref:Uncharacterized protein n=1 Tax=Romanomermis culicivorax TaxID=13658 RepID=A0A915IAX9_ROMCU
MNNIIRKLSENITSGAFMQVVGDAHEPHKSTVFRQVQKVVRILNQHYFNNTTANCFSTLPGAFCLFVDEDESERGQ